MIRNYAILFLLLINAYCTSSASAQKLTYKILLNNKMIGTLLADRQVQKEKVNYVLQSKMSVHKILTFDIEYKLESDFINGKMIASTAYQKTNNKIHTNTITKWDGVQYTVQLPDENLARINKNINYNMCTIYYLEPIGLTQIYSDAFGKFLNIRSLGNHRYELTLPDGKTNYYNYAAGICFQVESEQLFSKIIFRLTR